MSHFLCAQLYSTAHTYTRAGLPPLRAAHGAGGGPRARERLSMRSADFHRICGGAAAGKFHPPKGVRAADGDACEMDFPSACVRGWWKTRSLVSKDAYARIGSDACLLLPRSLSFRSSFVVLHLVTAGERGFFCCFCQIFNGLPLKREVYFWLGKYFIFWVKWRDFTLEKWSNYI